MPRKVGYPGPISGGAKLDRVESMQIFRTNSDYFQFKIWFQDAMVMEFDKIAESDALILAETIAGLTNIRGASNRWDRVNAG